MAFYLWGDVRATGHALGLTVEGNTAHGTLDGQRVWLGVEYFSGKTVRVARGLLDPPLDLGLRLRRREIAFGENPVKTGNDDLDNELYVDADEPLRAEVFFTKAVCDRLVALNREAFDMVLDDGGLALTQVAGLDPDGDWLARAARAAAASIAVLDAARASLHVAAPLLEHANALAAHLARWGFTWTTAPFSGEGSIDGRRLTITSLRILKHAHRLLVHAPFEADLGLGLMVRREGFFDKVKGVFGAADIQLGDAAFDKRFLIRANAGWADRVPALLDPDMRKLLLTLDADAGPVSIDDGGISIEPILLKLASVSTLPWMVDALDEARTRLAWNALRAHHRGAYR